MMSVQWIKETKDMLETLLNLDGSFLLFLQESVQDEAQALKALQMQAEEHQ